MSSVSISRWTRLSCATDWTWQMISPARICSDTYIGLPGFSTAGRPNASLQNLAALWRSDVWQSMITVLKRLWCMRLAPDGKWRTTRYALSPRSSGATLRSEGALAERGDQQIAATAQAELRLWLGQVQSGRGPHRLDQIAGPRVTDRGEPVADPQEGLAGRGIDQAEPLQVGEVEHEDQPRARGVAGRELGESAE